jgi:DNA-binding PadR family transcriptional regulator
LDILREFILGFVKIHILYHAGEGEGFSGVDMTKELRRHGYSIGPGTLYPTLHRLERGGYLRKEKRVKGGRMRIYYTISPKGRRALASIKPKIGELVTEVLGHEGRPAWEIA